VKEEEKERKKRGIGVTQRSDKSDLFLQRTSSYRYIKSLLLLRDRISSVKSYDSGPLNGPPSTLDLRSGLAGHKRPGGKSLLVFCRRHSTVFVR
jgi:hypothetical protein